MSLRDRAKVFSIAPGAPFLKTLANALCDGTLVEGFKDNGDPLALSTVTIYVPTRRAARALRSEFARRNISGAAILPTIKPLGEFDEDLGFFDETGESLSLEVPIGNEERILQLARLVRQWASQIPGTVRDLFGEDPMVLPSTSADAIWLARDLATLMDEVEREGGDWQKLKSIVPEALAGWWQLTLSFMEIVANRWPEFLQQEGLADPAMHRNSILNAETNRLREKGSTGPVIAAGSTGSVPATAELLSVIARLPQGAVVLPGLDFNLTDEAWDALAEKDDAPSVYGHPQFGLKKLLGKFSTLRGDVTEIGAVEATLKARGQTISAALMPADVTHLWSGLQGLEIGAGFAQVCEIVAPSESLEALAIAVALREAIENKAYPAALVTTDRTLARRVSAELERFGIQADDSGGTPLDQTPPAALFQMMLDVVFDTVDPARLLALLKHPLTTVGKDRKVARRGAEVLEIIAMRGTVVPLDIESILNLVAEPGTSDEQHGKRWTDRYGPADIELAADIGAALGRSLRPLIDFIDSKDTSVTEACRISVAAFEALGKDGEGSVKALYQSEAGEAFAAHLRALVSVSNEYKFDAHEWPSVYRALTSGQSVKPRLGSDPRVFIWGALEARLQDVETVILGSLNEKSWPARPSDDPFLSRGMKNGIGIEPPERRVGLAAHDFQMLMGGKRVILSRAARIEGAPSVPSRWLQRLHALLGESETKAMQLRAENYLCWARGLDLGERTELAKRPCPKPPVELRPVRFSVTEIETLRRDPYAIYAKRILGLEPLPPLIREPDARERGNLFHNILEEFVEARPSIPGDAHLLRAIGRKHFKEAMLPEETEAVWWRRFEKTIDAFNDMESERAAGISACHVELSSGEIPVDGTRATLRGRADRIDILKSGAAAIIDYKTGTRPSVKEAYTLIAPQLPLEAALLSRGGFSKAGANKADDLLYVRLKPDGDVVAESIVEPKRMKKYARGGEPLSAHELGEVSWGRLRKIIQHYDGPDTGYISRALPFSAANLDGDYDHLARVLEWSAGGEDGEGE